METTNKQEEDFKIRLKEIVLNNPNGFTIDSKTLKPIEYKKGFCISMTNNINHIDLAIDNLIILSKQEPFKDIEFLYFGGWYDKQTGLYYLDLTIIDQNKKISLAIARLFNQKAIFNLSNLESIYL